MQHLQLENFSRETALESETENLDTGEERATVPHVEKKIHT